MQRLYEGNIYDMKPLENGFVFVYCNEDENGQLQGAYNMISFETGRMSPVTKSNYLLAKFGLRYKIYKKKVKNVFESKVLHLPEDRVFILDSDGTVTLLDTDGSILWTSCLLYKDTCPTDIAIYKDSLWACFKEYNCLIRFNLNTMHEELRIGGGETSPFDKPVQLTATEDGIVICNAGSNSIVKLDPTNFSLTQMYSFREPLRRYLKVQSREFAALESGLYIIF